MPVITTHAIRRYMERICNITKEQVEICAKDGRKMDSISRIIRAQVRDAKHFESKGKAVRLANGNTVFVVWGNTVLTCYPASTSKLKRISQAA